jgi:dCTP deaminase
MSLFPQDSQGDAATRPARDTEGVLTPREASTGILPYQQIKAMLREHAILGASEILPEQLQPASLDLRLGSIAYRIRASFLPGPQTTVMDKIKQLDGYPIDLTQGAVLERGCVYVVQLAEALRLPASSGVTGFANPKSSTGRLDVLTRLITNHGQAFDRVERGYDGPLFVEIAPRTFSIVVRQGTRLNQLRFRRGSPSIASTEFQRLSREGMLILGGEYAPAGSAILKEVENMAGVTIDLAGRAPDAIVGYRAKKHTDRVDIDRVAAYDAEDFWEPIRQPKSGAIILDPDDFYVLVTREAVRVPPDLAAEMVAYDTAVGEFRVHYAGFFDPGFGWEIAGGGSKAVLEVRSHEVPFMLEHGQTVGWLRYERMAARPDRLYGAAIGSSYQHQGLALAKQFRVG